MNNNLENELTELLIRERNKIIKSTREYYESNKVNGIPQMIGRRYGFLWEEIVKKVLECSNIKELGGKIYYNDFIEKWIEINIRNNNNCCNDSSKKMLKKFLDENTGTSEQDLCDLNFEYNGERLGVDTKFRFISNDSNTVREIANSAKHLKMMGYKPILLFRREKVESLKTPLNRFEKEGWIIKCGKSATDFLKQITGVDIDVWIKSNINFWDDLKEYQEWLESKGFPRERFEF